MISTGKKLFITRRIGGCNVDPFKLIATDTPTTFTGGQAINDYDRFTWVEKYSSPGDFKIEAKLSSGLAVFLPIGSMISHIDTTEVMIVENHEIQEEENEDPKLIITGRSFTSYLENRIVGVINARAEPDWNSYVLTAAYSWVQIVKLINDHIVNPPANVNDALSNVVANHSLSGTSVSVERILKHDDVWKHVKDLLAVDNLGIRTIRRNPFGITGGSATETRINVYKGEDKTDTLMFSWVSGDIEKAHYLFSQKNNKNCALVLGEHFHYMVDGSETNYNRRIMLVDASDINKDGTMTLPQIEAAFTVRGQQALASQNDVSISQIDLSDDAKAQYRVDYNLGDLISLDGNYGVITTKRITEYAEIEDENGYSSHPTLSDPLE